MQNANALIFRIPHGPKFRDNNRCDSCSLKLGLCSGVGEIFGSGSAGGPGGLSRQPAVPCRPSPGSRRHRTGSVPTWVPTRTWPCRVPGAAGTGPRGLPRTGEGVGRDGTGAPSTQSDFQRATSAHMAW